MANACCIPWPTDLGECWPLVIINSQSPQVGMTYLSMHLAGALPVQLTSFAIQLHALAQQAESPPLPPPAQWSILLEPPTHHAWHSPHYFVFSVKRALIHWCQFCPVPACVWRCVHFGCASKPSLPCVRLAFVHHVSANVCSWPAVAQGCRIVRQNSIVPLCNPQRLYWSVSFIYSFGSPNSVFASASYA